MSALPTSFLVDKQGRMAKVYVGALSQKEVRADVDRLLAE
jgi:peroxiredoxin